MSYSTFYDHIMEISRQKGVTMETALKRAHDLGISCVDISCDNYRGKLKETKELLDAAGIHTGAVCAYFHFEESADITEGIEVVKEAAYLGAKYVLVIPGFFTEQADEPTKQEQMERMAEAISKLAVYAKQYQITLTMENYDNDLAPFSTIEGVKWFLDRVPELMCNFDTGNFLYSEQSELDAFEVLKDRIVYVHLKDRRLEKPEEGGDTIHTVAGRILYPSPVGSGVIRIKEILEQLKRKNYDGVYSLEFYGSADYENALEESVRWTKAHV